MVFVLVVTACRELVSAGGQLASSKGVLCSGDFFSDEEVFHRMESCPLENFSVNHLVLPVDHHDLP